jgi:hypothetical protein
MSATHRIRAVGPARIKRGDWDDALRAGWVGGMTPLVLLAVEAMRVVMFVAGEEGREK